MHCYWSVTFWYLRIRIPGSIPLRNVSGCGSGRPKTYGSGTLVHLHHSPKIKNHKEVTKQYKSRFFLRFILAWWWKDTEPDPFLWLTEPDGDPRRSKNIQIVHRSRSGSSTLPKWSTDPYFLTLTNPVPTFLQPECVRLASEVGAVKRLPGYRTGSFQWKTCFLVFYWGWRIQNFVPDPSFRSQVRSWLTKSKQRKFVRQRLRKMLRTRLLG